MHAVVFDIDGTLIQSASVDDALYKEAVRSVLGPVRFRPAIEAYDFVTDSGILSQILDDNAISTDPQVLSGIKDYFVDALAAYISENGPFEEILGAKRMLDTYRASREHGVAIATGGWRETALLKLRSAGFDLSGLPLATSDDSHDRTEIMRIALSGLGTEFRSVTYYGDGPWDQVACAALGWEFVAVGPILGGIESYINAGVT